MSFRDNLEKKIEIDRLALRVTASCGSGAAGCRVDREAMRRLLAMSPYHHLRQRDLDLYVKEIEGEPDAILVLDNELPIFRATVKDVVVRRSPLTLELWRISTIRRILVDSDIKQSVRAASVATVRRDAARLLDLAYNEADIEDLVTEGLRALAAGDAGGVEHILALFAELLGFVKPPKGFGVEQAICYGETCSEPDQARFGPLVLYRAADNTLLWIDKALSKADKDQMQYLRSIAAGESGSPVQGDAVLQKLKEKVLARPRRVVAV